jgi:hypothetical protein
MRSRRAASLLASAVCIALAASGSSWSASAQAPVTGHYPPGQSGIRGAATPDSGVSITNFNRLFTNLEGVGGGEAGDIHELRYANISMFTWTTSWKVLGMTYGALAGIPVATGDLRSEVSTQFGLGDILLTPISLYGKSTSFDHQVQFTVWTPSGHFAPGDARNRGTGFWALVYSLGGVYYPGGDRRAWSISAVARAEQNFEQRGSGIGPGDDVVLDWGIGRMLWLAQRRLDIGVSGFGAWQLSAQDGGDAGVEHQRYRLLGAGPEASMSLAAPLSVRVRAQWEFAALHIVRGNNLWIIVNYRL